MLRFPFLPFSWTNARAVGLCTSSLASGFVFAQANIAARAEVGAEFSVVITARAQSSEPSAPTTSAELWTAGRRAEAIDKLHAEIAVSHSELDSMLLARVVSWQLEVHRYKDALTDAARCGVACDSARAEALYRLGEYAQAVPLLSSADPEQVLMKIDALEALERFAESDAVLAAAQKIVARDEPRLQACDGRRLARIGRYSAAITAFRQAVAQDPLYGEALYGLGRALVANGEREEGMKVLQRHRELLPLLDQLDFAERAVDLAPSHAPNWTAVADAERALGKFDLALAAYEKAATLATNEQVVPNALRYARFFADDRKDAKGAITMLEKCHERVKDARLLVRAGDIARDATMNDLAVALYERALAEKPKDAEIEKRLGLARGKQ